MAETSVTSMWAPKGSKPKVKSYPKKDRVSYSGFVIPSTGRLYTCKPDWFNYETTIESIRSFLRECPAPEGCKYYMIMDNAAWHKKAKRLIKENANGEYSDIKDQIVFVYLPPYSPDLNPIEQVWRITRREAKHNRFFANSRELEAALDAYYDIYAEPNEYLRSLCTFHFLSEESA